MNLAALSLSLPLAALGLAALAGCNHSMSENHETTPERTGDASLTIMTFNVENLFDNVDDPGKEDRTYLALADKQSAEHKAACSEIEVDRWREQCLDWDWSDDRSLPSSRASSCRSVAAAARISSRCRRSKTSASSSGCARNISQPQVTSRVS
jgi:hypothetical protein